MLILGGEERYGQRFSDGAVLDIDSKTVSRTVSGSDLKFASMNDQYAVAEDGSVVALVLDDRKSLRLIKVSADLEEVGTLKNFGHFKN